MARPRIGIVGAGIMGCCTALLLSRAGQAVTLFDKAPRPMSGASRWNEGKIHLGYLYSGDPSGATAAKLMAGGLAFRRLIEQLLGQSIEPAISLHEDTYLVHQDSVVSAAQMEQYFAALDDQLAARDASSYLKRVSRAIRLSPDAIRKFGNSAIETGFRVPERSVNTLWIADRLVRTVEQDARVSFVPNFEVTDVGAMNGETAWKIGSAGSFDFVVNCAWEGLLAIDRMVGLEPEATWSYRYRVSLFAHTKRPVVLPSVLLATGPFGDVKNYDGRNFYLSWYPAGLLAEGQYVCPPKIDVPADAERIIESVKSALLNHLPAVRAVFDAADHMVVAGGWVFAKGQGSLSDPASSLHRRDRFGVRSTGTYFSVDTGKYSTAPLLAHELVQRITAQI
jgi:glycine/D-amino acid oxidase-like deaminating enzyme